MKYSSALSICCVTAKLFHVSKNPTQVPLTGSDREERRTMTVLQGPQKASSKHEKPQEEQIKN